MIQQEKLYTEAQMGAFVQLSRATMLRLRKKNKIPFYRINGAIRYSLPEVMEALKSNNV